MEINRFGQMYIITNMGIHKIMGTKYNKSLLKHGAGLPIAY